MKTSEIIVFIVYLLCMLGIGIFFFVKTRNGGEKTYFLGGREMGPWVAALSAGASDMSAWVLMGLPTSIYALGLGQVWIPVGLAIGYTISWLLEAPRLRKFSIVANDSITIPQYLTNRFLSKSLALQVICAIVFLVAYTIYAASSVKACGTLFHTVIGMDPQIAMYLAAVVIVGYTFLGGFSACMLDRFFPGHARAWFYVYSTYFLQHLCLTHHPCHHSGRLLKSILKLAGYRVRTGMGTWILWYATYHYQIHVHQITEGFEEISKNRNYMDSAYCIFCNFNRSNRKTFPWL